MEPNALDTRHEYHPITKSEADHRAALQEMERFIDLDPDKNTADGD